jgi:ADP-heptose:LPS heptosyltransferase
LLYASGGALPIRAWPQASFGALAKEWVQLGHAVGIIGLPADVAQANDIALAVNSPHCVSLAGTTANVRELIAYFSHAKVLVANDGGPGHFAALANMPAVMLFGPESPRLYGSLSKRVIALHKADMPCSPCLTAFNHRLSPCDGDNQCLKRISVAEVLSASATASAIAVDAAPPGQGA